MSKTIPYMSASLQSHCVASQISISKENFEKRLAKKSSYNKFSIIILYFDKDFCINNCYGRRDFMINPNLVKLIDDIISETPWENENEYLWTGILIIEDIRKYKDINVKKKCGYYNDIAAKLTDMSSHIWKHNCVINDSSNIFDKKHDNRYFYRMCKKNTLFPIQYTLSSNYPINAKKLIIFAGNILNFGADCDGAITVSTNRHDYPDHLIHNTDILPKLFKHKIFDFIKINMYSINSTQDINVLINISSLCNSFTKVSIIIENSTMLDFTGWMFKMTGHGKHYKVFSLIKYEQ